MIDISDNFLIGFYIITVFILIGTSVYRIYRDKKINEEISQLIEDGEFISADEFEKNWISMYYGKKATAGFMLNDGPGCYVITIYPEEEPEDDDDEQYDDVYVGQSVNVCKRVHNHLNGKGNGDVYADYRMGKRVYIQFYPCKRENMNDIEKYLIREYNATSSYNNTRGGEIKY